MARSAKAPKAKKSAARKSVAKAAARKSSKRNVQEVPVKTVNETGVAPIDVQAVRDAELANRPKVTKGKIHDIEELPIGAIVEHEGFNRWRVKATTVGAGLQFSHGATAAEAIGVFHEAIPPEIVPNRLADAKVAPAAPDNMAPLPGTLTNVSNQSRAVGHVADGRRSRNASAA